MHQVYTLRDLICQIYTLMDVYFSVGDLHTFEHVSDVMISSVSSEEFSRQLAPQLPHTMPWLMACLPLQVKEGGRKQHPRLPLLSHVTITSHAHSRPGP